MKLPLDLKHWYVIRQLQGSFYNLDSKLSQPQLLGDREALLDFLRERLTEDKTQLLLVVEPDTEQIGSWYKER